MTGLGQRVGIAAVGLLATVIMVLLGVWQLDVYQRSGDQAAAARAALPAIDLASVAPVSAPVSADGYGRTVSTTGRFDPTTQVLVPTGEAYRVLVALVRADGSAVPVVRGVVATPDAVPAPPSGDVRVSGVLMASEASSPPGTVPDGMLGGVQLDVLATRWGKPMIAGYVTLAADEARAQGLQPATVDLPRGDGRLRNALYAVQWWMFAAFAVVMTVRMVRDASLRRELDEMTAAGTDLESASDTEAETQTDAPVGT